jgi:hypothetical protein
MYAALLATGTILEGRRASARAVSDMASSDLTFTQSVVSEELEDFLVRNVNRRPHMNWQLETATKFRDSKPQLLAAT